MNNLFKLSLGVMNTNVYLLDGNDGVIVIDPADDAKTIRHAAAKFNKPIKYVLLTHGHFDHCNAARELQQDGAKVFMSYKDYEMIQNGLDLARYCGSHFNSFVPDEFLDEGERELCGLKIKILCTPGHTAGGLSFVIGDKIFCGDTLFFMSIGRSDLPTGDKATLYKSIKRLYGLNGDYSVFPGHGELTTLEKERKSNPYVNS